ncbi:hypothetical protein BC830DRAFT_1078248 [Chytriomyces sp. MP71]|nr:hypothetical protein BC830DRAFT_1078248 [Chytriomyces sp. MP71]
MSGTTQIGSYCTNTTRAQYYSQDDLNVLVAMEYARAEVEFGLLMPSVNIRDVPIKSAMGAFVSNIQHEASQYEFSSNEFEYKEIAFLVSIGNLNAATPASLQARYAYKILIECKEIVIGNWKIIAKKSYATEILNAILPITDIKNIPETGHMLYPKVDGEMGHMFNVGSTFYICHNDPSWTVVGFIMKDNLALVPSKLPLMRAKVLIDGRLVFIDIVSEICNKQTIVLPEPGT